MRRSSICGSAPTPVCRWPNGWPLSGVPFAFLTGYQGDAIPPTFKDRPVVAKPFTPDLLLQTLQAMVRKP